MARQHTTALSAPCGRSRCWRFWLPFLLAAGLSSLTILLAFAAATREPIVREATVRLPDWPTDAPPLRLLLVSDIHVAGPDMPPARVARLVRQMNSLSPDLVLLAGDFVSDKRIATARYSLEEAIRPLAAIKSTHGRFAVLGNHDHWRDAAQARGALSRAGIRLLDNSAVRAGPIAIGGLNDDFTGHADPVATVAAMRRVGGAEILLSHSPDPFPDLPIDVGLMLAGHTHCGQMSFPLIGAPATMSRHGTRYACGLIRESGKTLIVSAGVGTSILPLRIGVPPDMWLIHVGPSRVNR